MPSRSSQCAACLIRAMILLTSLSIVPTSDRTASSTLKVSLCGSNSPEHAPHLPSDIVSYLTVPKGSVWFDIGLSSLGSWVLQSRRGCEAPLEKRIEMGAVKTLQRMPLGAPAPQSGSC